MWRECAHKVCAQSVWYLNIYVFDHRKAAILEHLYQLKIKKKKEENTVVNHKVEGLNWFLKSLR